MCYSFHAFVLQFRMNEFGIMEMVTDDVDDSKPEETKTDKTGTAEGEGRNYKSDSNRAKIKWIFMANPEYRSHIYRGHIF